MGSRDLLIRPDVIVAKSARLREELHRLADQKNCKGPVSLINGVARQVKASPGTKMANRLTSNRQSC
jgi:hypothetical protein